MSLARRRGTVFFLSLVVLAALGALLLNQSWALTLTPRDRSAYGMHPAWQAAFDALSTVCGAGLLTRDLAADYTPVGRWTLLALGLAGAVCYLLAWRPVIRLVMPALRPPARRAVLLAFGGLLVTSALLAGVVSFVQGTGARTDIWAIWHGLAAAGSLGWYEPSANRTALAAIALGGALGWPVWLLWRSRQTAARIAALAAAYVLLLLFAAGLIALLEAPRMAGAGPGAATDQIQQRAGVRWSRGVLAVPAAAGAGLPLERLDDDALSEGSKLVLASVVLLGALGGSAGGGVQWFVLAAAVVSITRLIVKPCVLSDPDSRRALAAGTVIIGLVALTVLTATGLLVIENRVGSAFAARPTLADALLDSASAVGGANLSTGVVATVTSRTLSRGIRQGVDLYQYGMVWLMLALLAGRVMPLLVVTRLLESPAGHAAPTPPGPPDLGSTWEGQDDGSGNHSRPGRVEASTE